MGPNLGVFPLEQTRHVEVAKSEHPRLTNGEIILEEFQPYVITIHQRHRRTDRQTTCDRNTVLCTKVHRAVKTSKTLKSGRNKQTQKTFFTSILKPKLAPDPYRYDDEPVF